MERWPFPNNKSINCFMNYVNNQSLLNDYMAYGTTLYLSITQSMQMLRDQLPSQVTARNLAYYNQVNNLDCSYYIN